MNRTGDLLLCRWTTFQYTTKANADTGLEAAFKLLYIAVNVTVSRAHTDKSTYCQYNQ